jgi:hypothetical protein
MENGAVLRALWAVANSLLGLAALAWVLRQSGRVDAMYQYIFGVAGAKNGGASARLTAVEADLQTAKGAAAESSAGRELLASLEQLRAALETAAVATDTLKVEMIMQLRTVDQRLATLERKGRR